MKWIYPLFFIALIFGAFLWEYHKIQAVKKYYPYITTMEYFLLHDKLRIVSDSE